MKQSLKNKFYGCFFGSIVGDALGMPYEFLHHTYIDYVPEMQAGGPFNLPKGCWTDDTSMMLCLADSLIAKQGFDAQDQLLKYLRWYQDGYNSATLSCFDIGNQTRNALDCFDKNINLIKAKHTLDKAGNGALMRINPIPLVFTTNKDLLKYAELSTITTHNNDLCIKYSVFFSLLLKFILGGSDKESLKAYFSIPDIKEDVNGFVVGSYKLALESFYNTNSFEESMEYTIKKGGDTDTNACITGMLTGAYYGFDKIPVTWVNDLMLLDKLKTTCDNLFILRNSIK